MHPLLRLLLPPIFLLGSQSVHAECKRTPYAFKGPDEFISIQKATTPDTKGTVLLSHGGTAGKAGPLSTKWAAFLASNGYDAVVLSHFPQRGLTAPNCSATYSEADEWRREDALAVIKWLSESKSPQTQNIFIMGFSAGTAAVFPFVTDSRFQSDLPESNRIKGGILLYPWAYGCMNPPSKLTKQTLFIGAEEDNVMRCWETSSWLRSETQSKLITFEIFKGVTHAFDNMSMKVRRCTDSGRYPYCMEYNAEAHQKAEDRVLKFLTARLSDQTN